tara:strand:- start:265 stop:771 length:507 start_codon:yes stop_codon:yes gene_type:complete
MIQLFYDKIHTIFDGLEDDQKLEIFVQLGKKLDVDHVQVDELRTPVPHDKSATKPVRITTTPKKKWSGSKPDEFIYQIVKGYDPKGKGARQVVTGGMPQRTHNHIAMGEMVKIQYGYREKAQYFLCVKEACSDWEHDGLPVTDMRPVHKGALKGWGEFANRCKDYWAT